MGPGLRIGALLAAAILLAGCGTLSSVGDVFSGDDDSPDPLAPRELDRDFEPTIVVEELWSRRVGKGVDELYLKQTPAVIGSDLFVADRFGNLAATDLASGEVRWRIEDENVNYTSGPGGGEGMVLVGTGDARVIAREADNGKVRWVAKVSSEVLAPPQAARGITVVRCGDGNVFGLNSQTGAEIWNYDGSVPSLTLRGNSAPVIEDDIILVGFDSGRLVSLELKTGRPRWDNPLAIPSGRSDLERMVDVDAEPVILGLTIYVSSFHGAVTAMSLLDGQIEWTREISSYAGLAVGQGLVFVTDEDGSVWALERDSGTSVWKHDDLKHRFVSAPAYHDGYVVVGDFEGYLHWLDASSGKLVFREQVDDERIIAPAVSAGPLLLGFSTSGRVAAFRSP